jgi:hypothetical protein
MPRRAAAGQTPESIERRSTMKVLKVLRWIGIGVAAVAVFAAVLGLAVMWLWNWLMPSLFGLPALTFVQAVGLLVLCHLLFKGHTPGRASSGAGQSSRERHAEFLRRVRRHLGRREPEEAEVSPES